MKRRSFLSMTGLAAPLPSLTTPVLNAAESPAPVEPDDLWWPMVNEVTRFKSVSIEGRLELEVALAHPGEEELEPILQEGTVIGYSLSGRPLIGGFVPGISVVTTFDLAWDGRPILIPERFWTDLSGFRLQTLSVDLATLDSEQRTRAASYQAKLDHPRLVLSADQGTALIEWDRPEKGVNHSTFRWIVSKSGTVLRHRHRSGRLA
jgi:hypothetical protein